MVLHLARDIAAEFSECVWITLKCIILKCIILRWTTNLQIPSSCHSAQLWARLGRVNSPPQRE